MRQHRDQFVAWPGWKHLLYAVSLGLAFTAWFCTIYGTADYVTGLRSQRLRVHWDVELALPFVPAMLIPYMSIYPLFWLGPFVLRARQELRALVACMGLVTFCGGIAFLLFPAELAFAPTSVPQFWMPLFSVADGLNLRYNLAPSLHVALAVCCADAYARSARPGMKLLLWAWAAAIAASTVLTHQHHLLDVATGVLLGAAASRGVYARWMSGCRKRLPPA